MLFEKLREGRVYETRQRKQAPGCGSDEKRRDRDGTKKNKATYGGVTSV